MGLMQLGNHVPPLPLALLDILAFKDKAFLAATKPSLFSFQAAGCCYALIFVAFTLLNFQLNGGYWPYTFLEQFDGSVKKWSAFTGGVSVFLVIVITAVWHMI